jgi:NAD(P)-dependent dehydrogenase (short-subunit alcohol dehydrogenase family)
MALAGEGVSVAVLGRRSGPIEQTAAAIRGDGGAAMAIKADVSSEDDVGKVVDTVVELYGGLDILVNNAGIGGSGPIHGHSIEVWDRVMAVNLRGPFLLARYVLPIMREQRNGHIINISSESGLEHYPGNGAYGVSKHALNALGEYIQRENQDLGIRVDTICPGMVITEMTERSAGLNHAKSLYPEDIAELVLWLLSRRSNIKIGRPVLIQTMENPWE